MPPAPMMPSAPALEQAAANSPVAMLAMPPWMMGYRVPKISFKSFIEKPSQSMPSGIDSSPEGELFLFFCQLDLLLEGTLTLPAHKASP